MPLNVIYIHRSLTFLAEIRFFVTQGGIFAVISLCSLCDTYRNDTCGDIHQWRLVFTMIFASGD